MDLLEYQAKELLSGVGIPILPSQPIKNVGELKWLRIPYPIVLKSQVRVGGRGKAGGVRFVENTIDAIAAANAIFNLSISGEYPEVVLAEAKYNAQQEIFLAVLLDYELQRPVLLGSAQGGMEIDTLLDQMQKVVIEEDFSPFYARRLALKMGLKGDLIRKVSEIIEKMYGIFSEKDLDFIEINPLALNQAVEVMALDGKISINDTALARHPEILTLTPSESQETNIFAVHAPILASLTASKSNGTNYQGNIAIISNSEGLGLSAWDAISQHQGNAACCHVLNEWDCQLYLREELSSLLKQLTKNEEIQVILINWLSSPSLNKSVVTAIADYLIACGHQPHSSDADDRMMRPTGFGRSNRSKKTKSPRQKPQSPNSPNLVVRMIGQELTELKKQLTPLSVIWADTLEQAATQAVKLAKTH